MKNEIKLTVNGKEVALTAEQIKELGLEVERSPFERAERGEEYHYIRPDGEVDSYSEADDPTDGAFFKCANYCTDKKLMEHRALVETLSRLLWRWQYEHDEPVDLKGVTKWHIKAFINRGGKIHFYPDYWTEIWSQTVFSSERKAQQAIDEVVKPFIAAHPEIMEAER